MMKRSTLHGIALSLLVPSFGYVTWQLFLGRVKKTSQISWQLTSIVGGGVPDFPVSPTLSYAVGQLPANQKEETSHTYDNEIGQLGHMWLIFSDLFYIFKVLL